MMSSPSISEVAAASLSQPWTLNDKSPTKRKSHLSPSHSLHTNSLRVTNIAGKTLLQDNSTPEPYCLPLALSDLPTDSSLRKLSTILATPDVIHMASQSFVTCVARQATLRLKDIRAEQKSSRRMDSNKLASFPSLPETCQCRCHQSRKSSIHKSQSFVKTSRQSPKKNEDSSPVGSPLSETLLSEIDPSSTSPLSDRLRLESSRVSIGAGRLGMVEINVSPTNVDSPKSNESPKDINHNFACAERKACCTRRRYHICPYSILSLDEPIRIEGGLSNKGACDALLLTVHECRRDIRFRLKRGRGKESLSPLRAKRFSISPTSGTLEIFTDEPDEISFDVLISRIEQLCVTRTLSHPTNEAVSFELDTRSHWSIGWLDFVLLVTASSQKEEWSALMKASSALYAHVIRKTSCFTDVANSILLVKPKAEQSLLAQQRKIACASFAQKLKKSGGQINSDKLNSLALRVSHCLQDPQTIGEAIARLSQQGFSWEGEEDRCPGALIEDVQSDDAFVARVLKLALIRSVPASHKEGDSLFVIKDQLADLIGAYSGMPSTIATDHSDSVPLAVAETALAFRHRCKLGPKVGPAGQRVRQYTTLTDAINADMLNIFDMIGVRISSFGVAAALGFGAQDGLREFYKHAITRLECAEVKAILAGATIGPIKRPKELAPSKIEAELLTPKIAPVENIANISPLSQEKSPLLSVGLKPAAGLYSSRRLPPCPTQLVKTAHSPQKTTVAKLQPTLTQPLSTVAARLPTLLPPLPQPNRPQTAALVAVSIREQRLQAAYTILSANFTIVSKKLTLQYAWRAWMKSYAKTKSYRRRFLYPALHYPLKQLVLAKIFESWLRIVTTRRKKTENRVDILSELKNLAQAAEGRLLARYLDKWNLFSTSNVAAKDLLRAVMENVRSGGSSISTRDAEWTM